MEETLDIFHGFGSGRLDAKKGRLVLAHQPYKAKPKIGGLFL